MKSQREADADEVVTLVCIVFQQRTLVQGPFVTCLQVTLFPSLETCPL